MPYIRRNASGEIDSLHRNEEPGTEFIQEGTPELGAFLGESGAVEPGEFGRLDADFVRVIEDVIDTLIVKNVLNITDLPSGAQAKLLARKSFRERMSQSSLRLFEPTDFNDMI